MERCVVVKKSFSCFYCIVSLITTLLVYSSIAFAASGRTNVSIAFPASVIFSYQSGLNLEITDGYNISKVETGGAVLIPSLASAVTADSAITTTSSASMPSNIHVTVLNAWSIRASGVVSVAITCLGACEATQGGSTASVTNLTLKAGFPAAGPGGSIFFPGNGIGLGQEIKGDVDFDLNISAVSKTGAHTGLAWMITATAI